MFYIDYKPQQCPMCEHFRPPQIYDITYEFLCFGVDLEGSVELRIDSENRETLCNFFKKGEGCRTN